jgi:hypothetical protein
MQVMKGWGAKESKKGSIIFVCRQREEVKKGHLQRSHVTHFLLY